MCDFPGRRRSLFSSAPPPVIALISANYRPVIVPVILLSPRMKAFSEAVGNKDLFAGRVGQNRAILPVFTLLWMKMAAPLTLERMRRPHNADASHAIVQSALSARPRRPARRPAAP